MIIIDGGACTGFRIVRNLLPLAKDGNVTIYAFEPLPSNFDKLTKQFKDDSRIIPVCSAIGNQTGNVDFHLMEKGTTKDAVLGGTITYDKYPNPDITYTIPIMRLSDYWKEHINDTVDILKLNVEGAEYDIFEDLLDAGIINQFKRIIYEDHGIRCNGNRIIPSVLSKSKAVFKRLRAEFTGKIEFMLGGQWNLSKTIPSHLR